MTAQQDRQKCENGCGRRARTEWLPMCATTASGCGNRPGRRSATCTRTEWRNGDRVAVGAHGEKPESSGEAHMPLVRSFILSKKKGRECLGKTAFIASEIPFALKSTCKDKPPKELRWHNKGEKMQHIISGVAHCHAIIFVKKQSRRMGAHARWR